LVDLQEDSGERGRNRTYNLLIKNSEPPVADKENKAVSPAESGKVRQNPQPGRNREEEEDYYGA
jgi:hypothetical protein